MRPAKRGRPKGSGKKVKILFSIDKSIYKKLKKLRNMSGYVNSVLRVALENESLGEAGGSNPPGSKNQLTFNQLKPLFILWIKEKKTSKDYKTKLLNSFKKLNFSIYKNPEKIKTATELKLFYNIVKFFEERGIITYERARKLREKANKPQSRADNYVPTIKEVKETYSKLPEKHKIIFLALFYSGLRISEIDYLLENLENIKKQEYKEKGFVKYYLNWRRGNKSAYFAFLPYPISRKLSKKIKAESVSDYIKKHKLLPLKYLRKFFYTTAIEAGVPESIVDFIQGRSSQNIGVRHYLGKFMLSEKYYPKIMKKLDSLLCKSDNTAKPYQAYPTSYNLPNP